MTAVDDLRTAAKLLRAHHDPDRFLRRVDWQPAVADLLELEADVTEEYRRSNVTVVDFARELTTAIREDQ